MQITNVLAGVAVRDLDQAKRWYEISFARPADAEPMAGLAEWHTPGGVLQLVLDEQRAGGSLVTVWARTRGAPWPAWCPAVAPRSSWTTQRFEESCDEFPGRRGSYFVIPVASDPTMDSARAGALESDGGR
jgi:hypothetical protein